MVNPEDYVLTFQTDYLMSLFGKAGAVVVFSLHLQLYNFECITYFKSAHL